MQTLHNRRDFLASASLAGVASLLGRGESFAQEAPPETTTVRMPTGTLICNAPTYIADELLRAEGFTDIQRVPVPPDRLPMEGELDFAMVYTPPMIAARGRVACDGARRSACRMQFVFCARRHPHYSGFEGQEGKRRKPGATISDR
jgi:hypothetical protein